MGINNKIFVHLRDIARKNRVRNKNLSCLILGVQRVNGINKISDCYSMFKRLGFVVVDTLSIDKEENPTILLDLNKEIEIENRYDYVFDIGTLEHCFNLPMALFNTKKLTKKGGIIIHINPTPDGGWGPYHGYFSFSEKTYVDFYGKNGGDIISLEQILISKRTVYLVEVKNTRVVDKLNFPIEERFEGKDKLL